MARRKLSDRQAILLWRANVLRPSETRASCLVENSRREIDENIRQRLKEMVCRELGGIAGVLAKLSRDREAERSRCTRRFEAARRPGSIYHTGNNRNWQNTCFARALQNQPRRSSNDDHDHDNDHDHDDHDDGRKETGEERVQIHNTPRGCVHKQAKKKVTTVPGVQTETDGEGPTG